MRRPPSYAPPMLDRIERLLPYLLAAIVLLLVVAVLLSGALVLVILFGR